MISISIPDSVTATRRLAYRICGYLLPACCLLFFANPVHARDWQSAFYQDHALVGKIWDTRKSRWISEQQLHAAVLDSKFILLGETHDNPDHHRVQAQVLNWLAVAGQKPAVVMEMLAQEAWQNQPAFWTDLKLLQQQAAAQDQRWPWDLYTPLLQSVVDHRLQLVAGNVKRETLHARIEANGQDWRQELSARYSIPEHGLGKLEQEIAESHCGYVDAAHLPFMVEAQLQRDRAMTSALADSPVPAVLVAGRGHVRNDYAVPVQLRNACHCDSLLSVALHPVHPDALEPEDYLQGTSNAYDILYFTPNHTREVPCEKFSHQLQN
ncbi:MAG: ChaN family lipoprotein [Proteobacteria bacterium]|nr:ChaN family lipoprotein [Pseudomonadota bacterium]